MRFVTLCGLICAPSLWLLTACTEPSGAIQTMPTRADGGVFFAENCAAWHGADGGGGSTQRLSKKPPDLSILSAKNGGVFPAARALSYIYGDTQTSHLARVMPEFGPEMAEDLVPVEIDGVLTPTPRELAGLLAFLESIQK